MKFCSLSWNKLSYDDSKKDFIWFVAQDTDKNLTICEEILATYIKKRLKVRTQYNLALFLRLSYLFSFNFFFYV